MRWLGFAEEGRRDAVKGDGSMTMGRKARLGGGVVLIFLMLGLLVLGVRQHDGLNALYKRLKTADPYVFEEVRPELVSIDPADFLTVQTPEAVEEMRHRLAALVYGAGGRAPVVPRYDYSETTITIGLSNLAGVSRVIRYYLSHRPGVLSYLYLLKPEEPVAGRALIYHHGFAGNFLQHSDFLEKALSEGFTIVALDQFGYGENAREAPCEFDPDPECQANLQYDLEKLNTPLAIHLEPVLAGVDLLVSQGAAVETVDAIGFSAGAGTIVLAATVEPRLRRTVAVAGTLPYYLREGQDAPIGVADYPPLRAAAGMMDQYLLGAVGEGRAQLHLFNRYDRCCFRNGKGGLYSPVLEERLTRLDLGGRFEVAIDETHARHKISDWGAKTVLSFLTTP